MPDTASQLLTRDEALRAQQGPWLTRWQDIADFVAPDKSRILDRSQGPIDATELYDSTAIHAKTLLASSMHGTMTPSTQPWISFVMRDDTLNDQQEVQDWLEDCAARMHKALRQANFTTAVHEMYDELVSFGTAAILVEEKPGLASGGFGGFRFTTVPIGTYRVSEDRDGLVDTLFRDLKLSRRVCVSLWGERCGAAFLAKARTPAKADELVDVLHAVYPRRDRAYGADGPRRGATNLPWASCYIIREGKIKADEGGYEEFPYAVPRWSKIAGECYGTGPSHTAIYDVKTLNLFKRFMLQAIPLAMQPPSLERDDSVQGDIDRAPGGRIVVSGSGPLDDNFRFLDTHYKPEIAIDFLVGTKAEIERMYHASELQLRESPQMTATEVQVRFELMQRVLGPTTGRLESEFLNPFTWRCFALMARRGGFEALPGALREAIAAGQTAADLDLQYEGPLARAQRTIEITAQDRVIAFVAGITQVVGAVSPALAQQVWDVLNLDKMTRDRAEITGLASDALVNEQDVEATRAQRQAAVAQQQQMSTIMQGAEAIGKVAPLMRPAPGKAA